MHWIRVCKWIFKIKIQFRFQNSQKYQDEKVTLIIYFMLWTTMIESSAILANYNRLWFIISGQILCWDVRYLLCLNNKIFELMFFELWKKISLTENSIRIFMNVQLSLCAVDFMDLILYMIFRRVSHTFWFEIENFIQIYNLRLE